MNATLKGYRDDIIKINEAIRKHKALAAWGNVESKERLKELRARKKELLEEVRDYVK